MKLKRVLFVSAASFALSSAALAQQAQPGEQQPQDPGAQQQQQAPGAGGMQQQQPPADQGAQQQPAPETGAAGAQAGGQQMQDQQTVRKVQEKLNEEGYSVGPVDGVWGPKTEQALTQFQQAKGLEASGQLDEKTMSALGIEEETGAAGAQEGKPGEGAGGAQPEEPEKKGEAGAPGGAGGEPGAGQQR